MPGMQEQYAEEFRRQAKAFSALAHLTGPGAETGRDLAMVAVAQGLAEVCRMLAEACDEAVEEAKAVE